MSGATLPSNTIVGLDEFTPVKAAFKLGEFITHMDHRVDDSPPDWGELSESDDESDDESEYVGRTFDTALARESGHAGTFCQWTYYFIVYR